MGAGHSGSTILGVALGNCEHVVYAGEVEEWLANSGEPYLGGAERTRFWRSVRERVEVEEELFKARPHRYLERSSVLFRVDRWPLRHRLRGRYRRVSEELYRAIADVAGATHVVDTSHFPLRARELRSLPGIDMYLLFLFRKPQHVIASELRPVRRHDLAERMRRAFGANAALWLTHLLSVVVFLTHRRDRRLALRHEDFLAQPQTVLSEILKCIDSPAAVPDVASLRTGVPLIGNKLIRSELVALRTGTEVPAKGSRLTALLHLPWTIVLSSLRPAARPAVAHSERSPGSR